MTISEKLVLLQQDITNARTKITEKGGSVTESGGSSQLATDIATIPTGITPSGNIALTATTSTQTGINVTNYATASVAPTPSESKTLTLSSTSPSTVYPTSGKYLSSVVVSKDTSVIKADNIAKGKTILGVTGTYTGAYIHLTSSSYGATLICGSQTYTLTGSELSHAFPVTIGTYICKATLDTYESAKKTITVSANDVYFETLKLQQIPSEYQQVEYIASNGYQYINTGTNPFDGIYVESKMYLSNTNKARTYFGTGGDNGWGTYEGDYNIWDNYNDDVNSNVGSQYVGYMNIVKNGKTTTISISADGSTWYNTGVNHYGTYPSDARSIYIWAKNGSTRSYGIFKLYSFKIGRSSSDLIRNFIPCYRISGRTVGLWDTVGKTFYTNSGSGVFTAGPDVN